MVIIKEGRLETANQTISRSSDKEVVIPHFYIRSKGRRIKVGAAAAAAVRAAAALAAAASVGSIDDDMLWDYALARN